MFVINGIDVIVSIFKDGSYLPIFCGKDCAFSEEKEIIEASTVTSGEWKEFRLRKRSWAMEVSGLTKVSDADGQESYFNLLTTGTSMVQQTVGFFFTDSEGNPASIAGLVHIANSSIDGQVNEFATASVTFIGSGVYGPV